MTHPNESTAPEGQRFQTTHWSMVIAAADQQDTGSSDALAELCQRYWKPLYSFVRRSGHQSADAQDLTQAFFERLIEKRFIDAADESRGRFRTFVLAALKNFMANEWKKATRLKRSGGTILSLDFAEAENSLVIEPASDETVESQFDREWAVDLMTRVMQRLEELYSASGKSQTFEVFRRYLTADSTRLPYQQTADQHGMTAGQVKIGVHRMRSKYRELLEEEIGNTVGFSDLIQDEIQMLFQALQ